jgi:hypothetical protein
MTEWLLKLFNITTGGNARVTGSELVFTSGIGDWWLALLAIALAVVSVLLYRREADLPHWKRWTMAALRVALFVCLLLLIARPVLRFALEGDIRKAILVLVDASSSMAIADPRTERDDQQRALIAKGVIDPAGGLTQKSPATQPMNDVARLDLVRAAMGNPKLDLLNRLKRDYDIRAVSFGEQLYDVPIETDQSLAAALAKVNAERGTTAMGDAIRASITKSRGQPLAGLILVSDGASNAGVSPIAAAELASREGVPIYAWGVGITNPKDIAVASIFTRDVAFIDDELQVVTRIRSSGLGGQTVNVVARLNDKVVGEKSVKLQGDGEDLVTIPITPNTAGNYSLSVSVDPLASEAVKDNNSQAQQVRVIDGKIKVLYVEQQPRWEFKYLQAMLMRDRRVDAKFVLIEGDKSLAQVKDSPYLEKIPEEKEDLFKFDLIIVGDIDPTLLSTTQMEAMEEFVSKFGGAVAMIAGKRYAPQKFLDTPLAGMMPVEWEASPPGSGVADKYDQPIDFEITPAGRTNPLMRLADGEAENVRVWENLAPIYYVARVSRAKPAAEVLMVDADPAKATRFGKMPIIATQQYGLGTTMFVGTDNMWRWRKNAGDVLYARLWGQIIQRLALPRLLGESRRTQLVADRKTYSVGDRVTVYARLYTTGFKPITDATVRGTFKREGNAEPMPVILRQVPGQPGMYRAEITAPSAGNFKLSVETDPDVSLDLPVTEPKLEFASTAMNEPLLRTVAETSRGRFFREEDLHLLPNSIDSRTDKIKSNIDVEVWSSPFFFVLMLLLAGAEWVLRKTSYLK